MYLTGQQENRNGELYIGGISARELAARYGTPLYVMDESQLRERMRAYQGALAGSSLETEVIYAGKAFLNQAMARIVQEEGLSLDVVSGGELYTALSAGFEPKRIYFHGNNKSMEELSLALTSDVGCLIVDNEREAGRVIGLLQGTGRRQRILVRVNPGIEAHTHEYISTTRNDSKFGLSIFEETTADFLQMLSEEPSIDLEGLHCHIGSQIFEEGSFEAASEVMVGYIAKLWEKGIALRSLNLGGGFGIRYVEGDEALSPAVFLPRLLDHVAKRLEHYGLMPLKILFEPGRSIAANAGTTLYTVGGTKDTFGGKHYVFVDGSMADHPRTALYGAEYEAALAGRLDAAPEETFTVTGKACESGDLLIRSIALPSPLPGEILAVFATGAYHYSMASNYNRLPRPAVVLVKDGRSRLAVRRETWADLVRFDEEEEYTE